MARSRRSEESRLGRPSTTRRYKTERDIENANRRAFHEAAWKQRVCQVCGKGGAYQTHHVVEKQHIKQEGRREYLWDTRNAFRICHDCHGQHTVRARKIKLTELTDENYEFAFFFWGQRAGSYLRRHYDGDDPRLSDHQTRWELEHGSDAAAAA